VAGDYLVKFNKWTAWAEWACNPMYAYGNRDGPHRFARGS
jgi:hypothetical protein